MFFVRSILSRGSILCRVFVGTVRVLRPLDSLRHVESRNRDCHDLGRDGREAVGLPFRRCGAAAIRRLSTGPADNACEDNLFPGQAGHNGDGQIQVKTAGVWRLAGHTQSTRGRRREVARVRTMPRPASRSQSELQEACVPLIAPLATCARVAAHASVKTHASHSPGGSYRRYMLPNSRTSGDGVLW